MEELEITDSVREELVRISKENTKTIVGHRNKVWVKIKSGVYKGSIGELMSYFHLNRGNVLVCLPNHTRAYVPSKNLVWLKDYEGESFLNYNPKKKKTKHFPKDKVGQEVKPGMFVAYVSSQRSKRECLGFAEVIEARESGTLRVRPVDLGSKNRSSEEEVRHKKNYVVLSEEQKKGLMTFILSMPE